MGKKIRTWSDVVKVGIWDCKWHLTLYEDMAIWVKPHVKWVDKSANLDIWTTRFDKNSRVFLTLKKIATKEIKDRKDYTEEVWQQICDY